MRLGAAGVVLLFAGGIGVLLSPGSAVPLLGVMGIGLVTIAAAFLLVRTRMTDLLRMPEE
uniref:Uncharacterized protein n=1 Tax=uncultured euryarchaeote Rifle_16ft_4_minimus_37884 TaxID=1665196 RepID=A0A0H4T620_9EURY|nr:hypothetical protein [uncultured euryarchaeote Rifle_16ft_4_minimus_37884]